ncbi:4-hydroxyphenylacetate 3-hydroxylase family protein [Rhodoplanes sp. Z2-YC6860]|uniref:4-hydroxyphenylacetate 3-hydroxylase family protein n=1 Tax=Rhodoplanes sp. Z2-YC6860 TaxID=674703 RepID=UPI00078B298E|nr:4-hydroxyphenylacetate 3-hydroxylase N-terminal domain-containing protein [Rhodoplanes sp. Z2-YC6860]AMN40165.1 4-hydroxyphenylacetate 3-hydroxylase [Rhodoplanes sp. Z2-YC6860]
MLRTGDDYLQSLRDGRCVYIGGERVDDVTAHPAFRNTARSFARIYDRKREPEHLDAMTFTEDGKRCSSWFLLPRSRQDLDKRAECHRRLAEWSYGLLGRSPDHVPAFVGGMAMVPELFDANREGFGQNVRDYFQHLKQGDLFACYLVLTPQGSRDSKLYRDTGLANPALTVVKEDSEGIVVSGLKLLGTSAVFSNEAWVGSMIPLGPDQVAEAVTFAIPINQPGVQLWVRESFELRAANRIDHYFASQFDESDGVMVFDNVRVPWNRVFCHSDVTLMRDMYFKTPAHVMGNHQSNWRFVEKLKLIAGIAHKSCEMAGVMNVPAIQQTLGRLAAAEATLLGLMAGQLDQHQTLANGHVHVNRRFLYAALQWCASNYAALAEEVRSLMGAGPFLLPADTTVFENPETRRTFETYWELPSASADERYRFIKMAWDLLGSEFAGRHTQYEKFYGGPPHIMDLYSFFNCPWQERRAVVDRILTDMGSVGDAKSDNQ